VGRGKFHRHRLNLAEEARDSAEAVTDDNRTGAGAERINREKGILQK